VRISTQESADQVTFKVEGKIVGDWSAEMERFWKSLEPSLQTKKLCLDICGVAYVDGRGKKILQEIFTSTDAEILADSPLTQQVANEVRRKAHGAGRGGNGNA